MPQVELEFAPDRSHTAIFKGRPAAGTAGRRSGRLIRIRICRIRDKIPSDPSQIPIRSETKSRRFRDKNSIFFRISESIWGASPLNPRIHSEVIPCSAGPNAGFALSGAKTPLEPQLVSWAACTRLDQSLQRSPACLDSILCHSLLLPPPAPLSPACKSQVSVPNPLEEIDRGSSHCDETFLKEKY